MNTVNELEYREFLGGLKGVGLDTNDLDQMLMYRKSRKNAERMMLLGGIAGTVVGVLTLLLFIGLIILPIGLYILWPMRKKLKRQVAVLDHHWQVMQWPAMAAT